MYSRNLLYDGKWKVKNTIMANTLDILSKTFDNFLVNCVALMIYNKQNAQLLLLDHPYIAINAAVTSEIKYFKIISKLNSLR